MQQTRTPGKVLRGQIQSSPAADMPLYQIRELTPYCLGRPHESPAKRISLRVRVEKAARDFYNQKIGEALKRTNLYPGDECIAESSQVALTTLWLASRV